MIVPVDYGAAKIFAKGKIRTTSTVGVTAAVSVAPIGGAVATFFIGFGGKIGIREKARKILDTRANWAHDFLPTTSSSRMNLRPSRVPSTP